jgi:hypothetical protein
MFQEAATPANVPIMVEGIQINKIFASVIAGWVANVSMVAAAAETARSNAQWRSNNGNTQGSFGPIFCVATSAIMGSKE